MRHLLIVLVVLTACASEPAPPSVGAAKALVAPESAGAPEAAVGPEIVVENLATVQQTGWTFVTLPAALQPTGAGYSRDRSWRWVAVPYGVWLAGTLPASTTRTIEIAPAPAIEASQPFVWHAHIDPSVLPSWQMGSAFSIEPSFWSGAGPRPAATIALVSASQAHATWHIRTRIVERDITIDCWCTMTSGSPDIETTVQATWSTIQSIGLSTDLPPLRMICSHPVVLDYADRLGVQASRQTEVTIAPALTWSRAARIEVRGAICCDGADLERQSDRAMRAVAKGWSAPGAWMALGAAPIRWTGADATAASAKAAFLRGKAAVGHYFQREGAQPKNSGQTGEQPDFGCANGEMAVTLWQPWWITEALWQCQSYALRPTGNKEPNGDPIRAVDHPNTKTTNQRPDDRFSDRDPLGWYQGSGTIPYSWPGSGYRTSDDQHRADNLLHATYALTRDPALGQIIQDHIELQAMSYGDLGASGVQIGSPRGIGRPMLAVANQVWLGFAAAEPRLRATVEWCWRNAGYHRIAIDPAHTMRTLSACVEEAKYGWIDPATGPVRGGQHWQEVIAAIGLEAAHRVLRDEVGARAGQMAQTLAETAARHAWYRDSAGAWRHVYAFAWHTADPGMPWPPANLFPAQPNYWVYTDGSAGRWTAAALWLLTDSPSPVAARARELRAALAGTAASATDARWWAIGWAR